MIASSDRADASAPEPDMLLAAEMQDHLLTASNDLDRLQTLLAHACDTLASSFFGARDTADSLRGADSDDETVDQLVEHLGRAITALQFQDMASQLISHTHKRLRSCADRLAADAFDSDDGDAVIESAPQRPNPVTQDEMDAGSIELF
jgi:hypothetical protein